MRQNSKRDIFFEAGCPITKIKKYKNGCYEIVRESQLKGQHNPFENSTRGKITKMSNKSISRLIVTAQATDVSFASMLTLTYPKVFPLSGKIVKADVGYITQWLRKTYDFEYLWFLEFQRRAAPHLHVLLPIGELSPRLRSSVAIKWTERVVTSGWFESRLIELNMDDDEASKQTWKMLSVHVHSKAWEIIRNDGGARRYVTKYAAKAYQKKVPPMFQDVGRFWGCSQKVKPKELVTLDVSDDEVRDYLSNRDHQTADWEVLPKYLFNVNSRATNGASANVA